MRRVLLTVDLSYQIYRAAASHPGLTASGGEYTGGVYGFAMSLAKAIRETGATDCVACADSKPYLRSRDYPEYKQVRKTAMDPELRRLYDESEPLVLDLLRVVGIPVWGVPGFESDDLSASVVRRHACRYARIYAASNDSDLNQLLDAPSFAVYRDSLRTATTAASLLASTGLSPAQFMLASALQGTHNDIEGIKGVGAKTAAKVVRDPSLLRHYRAAHGAVIDRNLALIRLPHPELPRQAVPARTGPFNVRALYRWCSRLDIDTTLSMVNSFEQIGKP